MNSSQDHTSKYHVREKSLGEERVRVVYASESEKRYKVSALVSPYPRKSVGSKVDLSCNPTIKEHT